MGEALDRYNIGIGAQAAVIVHADGQWRVTGQRWGLVPSWEPTPETRYSTQTARLDRAPASRLFRRAWRQRRCLVPMNGYYKWDRTRKPAWPHFIQCADGDPLYAAGLWEAWGKADNDAATLESFAVLTWRNPGIPAPLTLDGPIFLQPDRLAEWVTATPDEALCIAQHCASPPLESYPVARRVADRSQDDYTLLEPAIPLANADDADDAEYDTDEALEDDDQDQDSLTEPKDNGCREMNA